MLNSVNILHSKLFYDFNLVKYNFIFCCVVILSLYLVELILVLPSKITVLFVLYGIFNILFFTTRLQLVLFENCIQ